jgi:hypothetical protein
MFAISTLLPLASSILSFVFALAIFRRYLGRPQHHHLLVWGIGVLFYGIGGASEAYTGAFGFNPVVLKVWYLFGAILVAAWLGQGTVFLLARDQWVRVTTVILVIASVFAMFAVIQAGVDPNYRAGAELTGRAFTTTWVRVLTPFFNIYGTVTLTGGALYSAWLFWRKRVLPNRMVGNILIAAGAMAPAFGGVLNRFGLPGLYIGEFIGVLLMYIGFLQATAVSAQPSPAMAPATQSSGAR